MFSDYEPEQQFERQTLPTQYPTLRVLVVEDDLTFRPLWESVIYQMYPQARLDWATSEEHAEVMILDRFRTRKAYDLVVADIFLAGQRTGIELWQRFGEAARQFIFVSGIPREEFDFLVSPNLTSPIYLQKPLRPRDCKLAVEAAI